MNTNDLFCGGFLSVSKGFKQVITSNSKYDFLDFIVTYGISSRKLLFCLFKFYYLRFKKILFPFYFQFKINRCDGKEDIITKFYEFILNICLIFF